MRNDYIQYLTELKIKEVDELLNNYFEDKITFAEFDLKIIQWAVNERGFIKNEKIENLFKNNF